MSVSHLNFTFLFKETACGEDTALPRGGPTALQLSSAGDDVFIKNINTLLVSKRWWDLKYSLNLSVSVFELLAAPPPAAPPLDSGLLLLCKWEQTAAINAGMNTSRQPRIGPECSRSCLQVVSAEGGRVSQGEGGGGEKEGCLCPKVRQLS